MTWQAPSSGPLSKVAATFPKLDQWGRLVRAVPDIQTGSRLAEDRAVFPWKSTSDLAWEALAGAQDHLKGFRAWLQAGDLYPMATFSLLRGALVGGALAAWLLQPDESEERVGRGLVAAEDWFNNFRQWSIIMADYAGDPTERAKAFERLEERLRQVRQLRVGRKPAWKRLNMTEIIKTTNEKLWPNNKARADQTEAIWRAGSGDAHAFGWAVLSRGHVMTPVGGGMGEAVSDPSVTEVANAYLCAYYFAEYGFARFDKLRRVAA